MFNCPSILKQQFPPLNITLLEAIEYMSRRASLAVPVHHDASRRSSVAPSVASRRESRTLTVADNRSLLDSRRSSVDVSRVGAYEQVASRSDISERVTFMGSNYHETATIQHLRNSGPYSDTRDYKSKAQRLAIQERMRRMLRGSGDDEEEDEYIDDAAFGGPSFTEEECAKQHSAEFLCALIKGSRYRQGACLVSYLDGSAHDGVENLRGHNAECIAYLHNALAAVPERDTLLKKDTRVRLHAPRCAASSKDFLSTSGNMSDGDLHNFNQEAHAAAVALQEHEAVRRALAVFRPPFDVAQSRIVELEQQFL